MVLVGRPRVRRQAEAAAEVAAVAPVEAADTAA